MLPEIYDPIINILDKHHAIYLDSNNKYNLYHSYLKDETFLTGEAHILIFPKNHNDIIEITNAVITLKKELPLSLQDYAQITIRGLGSGLSGACVPTKGIVLCTEKMDSILGVDVYGRTIHTQSGCITANIHKVAQEHNLLYPPDPSSSSMCSIGGNIATNAAGPRSYKYGSTRNYIRKLRMVWGDGTDSWIGANTIKNSMGLDLKHIVTGSEGQLGIITEVVLDLIPQPSYTHTLLIGFDTYEACTKAILKIALSNIDITCIEFMDERSLIVSNEKWKREIQNKKAALLIEYSTNHQDDDQQSNFLISLFDNEVVIVAKKEQDRMAFWEARKSITSALKKISPYKIGEDICIPVQELPNFIPLIYTMGNKYKIYTVIWGHAGDGNLHINMLFNDIKELPIVYKMMEEMAQLTINFKGTISGEHGLGRLKRNLFYLQENKYTIEQQKAITQIFNPYKILNQNIEQAISLS